MNPSNEQVMEYAKDCEYGFEQYLEKKTFYVKFDGQDIGY
jgi:hypothetical protein